jgi:hypothetical protein
MLNMPFYDYWSRQGSPPARLILFEIIVLRIPAAALRSRAVISWGLFAWN